MTVAVAAPRKARATTFVSLRWQLLLSFTLLFSAVFAAAFYWFYVYTSDRILSGIASDLRSTLVATAARVNTDALMGLYEDGKPNADGFSDDARYETTLTWLDTAHELEPRGWSYIMVPGSKAGEVIFVVDLYSKYDKNKAARFREVYTPVTPYPVRGFVETVINTTPYRDKWGDWISGYSPIKDAGGKVVAAIGMDFSASYLREVQAGIRNQVVVAFALTYLALFVFVLLLSNIFTGPLKRLTVVAARIGDGKYEQDWNALRRTRVRDEIGTLTNVFEQMVAKVYKREQDLQREVQVLRIEIDEAKKNRQVSEIVDSEFFRELKSKARVMRARAQWPSSADDEEAAQPAVTED